MDKWEQEKDVMVTLIVEAYARSGVVKVTGSTETEKWSDVLHQISTDLFIIYIYYLLYTYYYLLWNAVHVEVVL